MDYGEFVGEQVAIWDNYQEREAQGPRISAVNLSADSERGTLNRGFC